MIILKGYSELADAYNLPGDYAVKGIDWETRFIRPYRCHIIKIPAVIAKRICTLTYNSIALPQHKFLVNPLPYPFSSVPLTSLLRVPVEALGNNVPIAVAPIAEVSNNPYYLGGGVILDHVITFSPVRSMESMSQRDAYDIVLDEGNNYILSNTVRVL